MSSKEPSEKTLNVFSFWFNSIPGSTILGAIIISIAILISGGVIKIKGITATSSPSLAAQTPPTPTAVAPQPEEVRWYPLSIQFSKRNLLLSLAS